MKKLFFARHGSTEMNIRNLFPDSSTPLTLQGREQARQAGKDAAKLELAFDVMVSSDLIRAYQTAELIAEQIGYSPNKIVKSPLFRERDYGRLEGVEATPELLVPYYNDESYFDQYGAEPFADMVRRANNGIAYLQELGVTILVIGHGAHGRSLYRVYRGLTPNELIQDFENAKIVDFDHDYRLHQ